MILIIVLALNYFAPLINNIIIGYITENISMGALEKKIKEARLKNLKLEGQIKERQLEKLELDNRNFDDKITKKYI
ncbi:hypothetical protein [Helicobacter sp. 11S02596-1]|uniref:hypothetical protein n=1 Tax=Helicobacter sp. 11S02596-1 TaxID=1476194 RepID=UPI000BA798CC|nr:hypothetical protein [Helicobacter sp. 11S02596-1]PAF43538.1 hypothetical protein BJI48_04585 [Helicobacter sp. 11S02596-1]